MAPYSKLDGECTFDRRWYMHLEISSGRTTAVAHVKAQFKGSADTKPVPLLSVFILEIVRKIHDREFASIF